MYWGWGPGGPRCRRHSGRSGTAGRSSAGRWCGCGETGSAQSGRGAEGGHWVPGISGSWTGRRIPGAAAGTAPARRRPSAGRWAADTGAPSLSASRCPAVGSRDPSQPYGPLAHSPGIRLCLGCLLKLSLPGDAWLVPEPLPPLRVRPQNGSGLGHLHIVRQAGRETKARCVPALPGAPPALSPPPCSAPAWAPSPRTHFVEGSAVVVLGEEVLPHWLLEREKAMGEWCSPAPRSSSGPNEGRCQEHRPNLLHCYHPRGQTQMKATPPSGTPPPPLPWDLSQSSASRPP